MEKIQPERPRLKSHGQVACWSLHTAFTRNLHCASASRLPVSHALAIQPLIRL